MAESDAEPLPCLKESKWVGRGNSVCRPLVARHAESVYMPWVAVGYDHPHTFEFISRDRLSELQTTEQALEARAVAALRRRSAEWTPADIDVDGTMMPILTCTGDFFSAERVLDVAFMQEAQRILKAKGLVVGLPCRSLMMVTSLDQPEELIVAFAAGVAGQFARAENALISAAVFAMKDGVIFDILEDIARATVPDGEPGGAFAEADAGQEDEAEEDPGAPYVSALVALNEQGLEDVHLMAGGVDGERLAKAIEAAFKSLFNKHSLRAEFSGHIQIVILGHTPVSERKHIPRLLEHLRGMCSELSRGRERRYRVSLTYQKDSWGSADAAPTAPAPKAATTPRRAPVVAANVEERPRSWWKRAVTPIAILAGLAVGAYQITRSTVTGPDYPATLSYGGAVLTQGTSWQRGAMSAVVYVPAGETMPTASRQLGVITSADHATPMALLLWIRQQSALSSTQPFYDVVIEDGRRCLAGLGEVPNGTRPFYSLQLCKPGPSRAACIELDDVLESATLSTCLSGSECWANECARRFGEEKESLERALAAAVGQ